MADLELIKEQICDDYCKYRDMAFCQHKDVDEAEYWLEEYCAKCPLNEMED